MHRPGVSVVVAAWLLAGQAGAGAAQQQRPDVAGLAAAVVADHPLAAAAGADVLRRGGNAMDAAITMAAVLAVVRPHMNGVGGDAFLLYRAARSGQVVALNGSGRAAELATPAMFAQLGLDRVPTHGVLSVTTPGAVRLWADALRRYGTITLEAALAPAIRLAEQGFAVSTRLAHDLEASRAVLEADSALRAVFLPGGAVPAPGTLLRQRDLAQTLRSIASDGADAFYVGNTALRIDAFMAREHGLLRIEDLAAHSSTWQMPIETSYRGQRVLALPPNSQSVALLMQLNMAEQFDLSAMGHNSAEYAHTLAELTRLAFAERNRHVADPAFVEIPLERLLSKEHARLLVRDMGGAAPGSGAAPGTPPGEASGGDGDTVFLGVVDAEGNAVSMIQSLFHAFGSGRMVPGTGIVLHNRGSQFSLEPESHNVIAPRKRPYHTLTAALALRADGTPFLVFGTPGGDGQTQTLMQVFQNIVVFGMSPQQAVEAPRWRVLEDGRLLVEETMGAATLEGLAALGYTVREHPPLTADLGGAQVILLHASGARIVGADPRREAYGIAW